MKALTILLGIAATAAIVIGGIYLFVYLLFEGLAL